MLLRNFVSSSRMLKIVFYFICSYCHCIKTSFSTSNLIRHENLISFYNRKSLASAKLSPYNSLPSTGSTFLTASITFSSSVSDKKIDIALYRRSYELNGQSLDEDVKSYTVHLHPRTGHSHVYASLQTQDRLEGMVMTK